MAVDYNQFLDPTPVTPEPVPSPAPALAPSPARKPVDYSQFLNTGPAKRPGQSFIDSLRGSEPALVPGSSEFVDQQNGGEQRLFTTEERHRNERIAVREQQDQRLAQEGSEALVDAIPGGSNAAVRNTAVGLAQTGQDAFGLIARLIDHPSADRLNRQAVELGQYADVADETSVAPAILNQGLRGSVRSLSGMALTPVKALTAGNMIATAATVRGNQAITEGKDANLDTWDTTKYAARAAAIEGVVSAAFQRVGLGGVESTVAGKQVTKSGILNGLKAAGVSSLQELPEEITISVLDSVNQAVSKVNPDAVSAEALSDTIAATVVQTLMTAGMASTGRSVVNAMTPNATEAPVSQRVQDTPMPEEVGETQTDLRPVDVQNLESQLNQEAGIPSWVPEDARAEIIKRFRPDERSQIPGLDVQDFKDSDHVKRLQGEVRSYLDTAKSESDIDTYNATVTSLDEAPDAKPKIQRITGRPSYVEPSIEDDASIAKVAASAENISADEAQDSTQVAPAIKFPAVQKPSDTALSAPAIKVPATPKPNETQAIDVPIAKGQPRTPTTELRKFLSPKAVVAYNSLSDIERNTPEIQSTIAHLKANPDPNGDVKNLAWVTKILRDKRILPAEIGAKSKLSARPNKLEGRQEPAQSFETGDPNTKYVANEAERGKDVRAERQTEQDYQYYKELHTGKRKFDADTASPEDHAQHARYLRHMEAAKVAERQAVANFDESQGPYKSPEASVAQPSKTGIRSSFKGAVLVRRVLGPDLGSKSPAPKGFEDAQVRLGKDAGVHSMKVKSAGDDKHFVAWDESRSKAVIVSKTDTKGRLDPNGSEFRPLDSSGQPRTAVGPQDIPVFDSIQEAVKFAAKFLPEVQVDAKPEGINVGTQDRGIEDPEPDLDNEGPAPKATKDSVSKAQRKSDLRVKMSKGDLTDEEIDELEALEKPVAKEVKGANSPLTPKMSETIAELVEPGMAPEQVGKIVQAELDDSLKRPATFQETRDALKDLKDKGLISEAQSLAKLERPFQADILGAGHLLDLGRYLGKTAKNILSDMVQDLRGDISSRTMKSDAIPKGHYGYYSRTLMHAVQRATGLTGRTASRVTDAASRIQHLLGAPWVSAQFPDFAPIHETIKSSIDMTRLWYQEAYEKISAFAKTKGEARIRLNGAMVQFRLEERKNADFGNPITYVDERGKSRTYTLEAKELKILRGVRDQNKKVLKDYVTVMLRVFSLPPKSTSTSLELALAAGTVSVSIKKVIGALKVLEKNVDSYFPLKRFGESGHANIYDAVAYGNATTIKDRKKALLAFMTFDSLADKRQQLSDALEKWPGAIIDETEELRSEDGDYAPPTAVELAQLAKISGVPEVKLKDFLDAGIGDFLATRGLGARFAAASKLPGFSHDMLRSNSSHLKQMITATSDMMHRHVLEMQLKKIEGDKLLHEYADRMIKRLDTPLAWGSSTIKEMTTLWHLGLGIMTALGNESSSLITAPMKSILMTLNPMEGVRTFIEANKRMLESVAAMFNRGIKLGDKTFGKTQVEAAATEYDKSDPVLARAIRTAHKEGAFVNTLDREADRVARFGETTGAEKGKELVGKGLMHFFSKTETANRISLFVAGYKMWPRNQHHKTFRKYLRNAGFYGDTAIDFAKWFSEDTNFRMDRTENPSWSEGFHGKGNEFTPNQVNVAVFALKSWAFGYVQNVAIHAKAAVKTGVITASMFAALTAGMIAVFGAKNVIPGAQTVDKVAHYFSGKLDSPAESIAEDSDLGRAIMTGGAGLAVEKMAGERAGGYVDAVAERIGSGNVIPSGIESIAAPLSVYQALAGTDTRDGALQKIKSGDTPRVIEGVATLGGKAFGRMAEYFNEETGTRGDTSANGTTVVPNAEVAWPGAPSIDKIDRFMKGIIGLQPPVVKATYRLKELNETMKKSNDNFQSRVINEIVDAFMASDNVSLAKLAQEVQVWNQEAMDKKEYWRILTERGINIAVQSEYKNRKLGAANMQAVPVTGRGKYKEELDEEVPEENKTKPKE